MRRITSKLNIGVIEDVCAACILTCKSVDRRHFATFIGLPFIQSAIYVVFNFFVKLSIILYIKNILYGRWTKTVKSSGEQQVIEALYKIFTSRSTTSLTIQLSQNCFLVSTVLTLIQNTSQSILNGIKHLRSPLKSS